MIRKISLYVLAAVLPGAACAEVSTNNTEFRWSLAAMGDTIEYYYNYYSTLPENSTLGLPELVKMGGTIKENPVRSPSELVRICVDEAVKMPRLGLKCIKDKCERMGKTYSENQPVIRATEECTAFVQDLIVNNNNKHSVKIRKLDKPGTYIRKAKDKCNGQVYEVVTVIPGKETDNNIYLIQEDDSVLLINYKTQNNRTFINETAQSKEVSAGEIRGVYNKSYIFFTDVTQEIYKLYNSGRGTPLYSAGAGAHLLPGQAYDFKDSWTRKECDPNNLGFAVPDQEETARHTNGVIYKGQVVTLENLGHIITGMHQEDSVMPKSVVEKTVSKLQGLGKTSLKGAFVGGVLGSAVNPAGAIGGALTGAYVATPSAQESPYANQIREEAYQDIKDEKDDKTFAKTKTVNNQRAYNLARMQMAQTYNLDSSKISCYGECNTTYDDFVSCYYKNGSDSKVIVYKFDSICSGSDKNIPAALLR